MSLSIASLTTGTQAATAQYNAADRRTAPVDVARAEATPAQGDTVRLSPGAIRASVRHESNRQILQQFASSQATSPEGSASTPLSFTLEQLESESGQAIAELFDELGIDLSDSAGIDQSAEATSDRIVDASTAMYATFARQNSDLEGEDLIAAFETTLHDSVDLGYGEAREMLDGIGVGDDIIALGEDTMGLVHAKFDSFFEGLRAQAA
ncbi:MAG: DUF5610 domain-containing protein [Nannocystaceae bacterium]|nr:DUF5610 domain-containing protein [Nannocystaceae bacterium]